VSCYGNIPYTGNSPPPFSLDSDNCSSSPIESKKYTEKIKKPQNPNEAEYIQKAMDFLTGIETNNEIDIQMRVSLASVDVHFEGLREKSGILVWKSHSGKIHKSYSYCLRDNDSNFQRSPQIDLRDAPNVVRNSPLKVNLNEEFRERYPFLDDKLTLSKIANLKEKLIFKICKELDVEAFTVSVAWSYFQRLLGMNVITKANRKLYAAICVLLSYKFNEEINFVKMKALIHAIRLSDKNDISQSKSIAKYEFEVYSYLKFSMIVPVEEFEENFHYILKRIHTSPKKYLENSLAFSGLKHPF